MEKMNIDHEAFACFLYKTASFLEKNALNACIKQATFKSPLQVDKIIKKQYRSMIGDLYSISSRADDESVITDTVNMLRAYADNEIIVGELKKVPQSKMNYVVKRNSGYIENFFDVFSYKEALCFRMTINERLDPLGHRYPHTHDVQMVLYGLFSFMFMLETIALPEKLPSPLANIISSFILDKPDYFTDGYPYDLLVHDRYELENNREDFDSLWANPQYCSTFYKFKSHPLSQHEGMVRIM